MKLPKITINRRRERLESFLTRRFDQLENKIVAELTSVVAYYKAYIERMPCEKNTKLLKSLNDRIEAIELLDLNNRIEALEKVCKIERQKRKRKLIKS